MGFGNIFKQASSTACDECDWDELNCLQLLVERESYKVSAALLCSCKRAIKASKIVHRSSKAASTIIWIFFLASSPPSLEIHCWFFSFFSSWAHISAVRRWSDEIRSVTVGFRSRSYRAVLLFALNGIECWMNLLPRTFNAKRSCELCFPHTRDSIVDARTQSSLLLVGVSRYLTAVLPFPNRVSLSLVCRFFHHVRAKHSTLTIGRPRTTPKKTKAGIHIGLIILWAIKYNCASNYKFTRCSVVLFSIHIDTIIEGGYLRMFFPCLFSPSSWAHQRVEVIHTCES